MTDLAFDCPMLYPPDAGSDCWTLAADWTVFYDGQALHLPMGFKTDGASIPPALRPICGDPMQTPRLYAAIVHDFLYSGGIDGVTRAQADALFRDMCIKLGVSRFRAYVEYYTLRLFGGAHWEGACAVILAAMFAAACGGACGCATKTRNVEIDGAFIQAESATVAIGSVDVMAAPVGEESAIIKYEEDTAWLSPSTKTHALRIQLTGTNATACVTSIVESICRAFVPTAAFVNGVTNLPPVRVEVK